MQSLSSCAAVLFLMTAITPAALQAQVFPSRPVTLVVPYPPGGTTDIIPRVVAPLMSVSMGVPVVVENRGGANGSIGAAHVARSRPDGYTVLMAPTGVLAINQWLYAQLPYSPEKDFAPVINTSSAPNMLVVHPSVPAATVRELIALLRARPNSLSFASQGNGSTGHMCGEMFKAMAGVEMAHIPYKGSGPAQQDLVGGQVPMMCENFSNAIPHVRAGRVRALAVTGRARHPQAPEIPTVDESGVPGFEAGVWYSFVVAAGTPRPVIDRLNTEIAKALRVRETTERLNTLGLTIVADTPEEFGRFIASEAAKWRKVVQASGARID